MKIRALVCRLVGHSIIEYGWRTSAMSGQTCTLSRIECSRCGAKFPDRIEINYHEYGTGRTLYTETGYVLEEKCKQFH